MTRFLTILIICIQTVNSYGQNDSLRVLNIPKVYGSLDLSDAISEEGLHFIDSLNNLYYSSNNKEKKKIIQRLKNDKNILFNYSNLLSLFVVQKYVYETNCEISRELLSLLEATGIEYWKMGYSQIWPFILYPRYDKMNINQLENLYQLICVLNPLSIGLSENERNYLLNLKKLIVRKNGGYILE